LTGAFTEKLQIKRSFVAQVKRHLTSMTFEQEFLFLIGIQKY
jgi:hypothetical protein